MDYLQKLTEYYSKNQDKLAKQVARSHKEFSIEDGEDIVQDAFENLCRNQKEDFSEGLARFAISFARRKHLSRYIKQTSNEVPEGEGVEDTYESRIAHFNLTQVQAKVLELFAKGLHKSQIAEHLGVTRKSVHKFFSELSEKSDVGGNVSALSRL